MRYLCAIRTYLQAFWLLALLQGISAQREQGPYYQTTPKLTKKDFQVTNEAVCKSSKIDYYVQQVSNGVYYMSKFCKFYCENEIKFRDSDICDHMEPICLDQCRCNSDCTQYGDCCLLTPTALGMVTPFYQCISILASSQFSVPEDGSFSVGYFMGKTCANSRGITDSNLSPVTSRISNVTYYNAFYALCNDDTSFVTWTARTKCIPLLKYYDYQTGSGAPEYNTNNSDSVGVYGTKQPREKIYKPYKDRINCKKIFSIPPHIPPPKECNLSDTKIISECNVTGQWPSYDKATDLLCQQYYFPVVGQNRTFKNIFCYVCNGLTPERDCRTTSSRSILILTSGSDKVNDKVFPLDDFNFKNIDNSKKGNVTKWKDNLKGDFRKVQCSPGRRLINMSCIPDDQGEIENHYLLNIILKPDLTYMLPDVDVENLDFCMILLDIISNLMARVNSLDFVFTVSESEMFENLTNSILHPNMTRNLPITIDFAGSKNITQALFEKKLLHEVQTTWVSRNQEASFAFSPRSFRISKFSFHEPISFKSDPTSGRCCHIISSYLYHGEQAIYVSPQMLCPHVHLQGGLDFELLDDGSMSLTYINATHTISISPANFTEDGNNGALICLETLVDFYRLLELTNSRTPTWSVQDILSYICVSLSLLCLACTFVTYCTFPVLRTLPGKNNMVLVANLFLAQGLLLFGVLRTENQVVCKVIGVMIHYLWLSVVLWMSVCSFHMFYVFVVQTTTPISKFGARSRLLKYGIFGNGLPLLIIIITIVVSTCTSDGHSIGYGGMVCYLSSKLHIYLAFILPLIAVLVANTVFFFATVCTISKITQVKKDAGNERQNIFVYIKLSSLTGIFWIVNICASSFGSKFLEYLAIILSGSQGVFIFMSYMLNRRVFMLWTGRWSSRSVQSTTVTTSL